MTTRTTLPVGSMSRRQLLTVLFATPLVATFVTACGSDGGESAGSPADPTTTTLPSADGLTYPTGAEEVVVRIDTAVGAYTTPEYAFARIPSFVVTGDGTTITPGAQIEIYPAPMLPALQSTTMTSVQIAELLGRAASLGLLSTPPDYTATQPPIADAGSTVVTFNVNGTSYVHTAPALGLEEDQSDDARRRLAEFVEFATTLVGEANGTNSAVYEPAEYVIATMVVNVSDYTGDVAPTVVPWPASFGEVPNGERCSTVDGATVRDELAAASQLTFFDTSTEEPAGLDIVQLLLRPVLPGSDTC